MTSAPIFPCLDILAPIYYMESKSYSSSFTTASGRLSKKNLIHMLVFLKTSHKEEPSVV